MFPLTNDREVGWEVARERQNTANAVSTQIVSMNRENGALISRGVFVQFSCQDTYQHAQRSQMDWNVNTEIEVYRIHRKRGSGELKLNIEHGGTRVGVEFCKEVSWNGGVSGEINYTRISLKTMPGARYLNCSSQRGKYSWYVEPLRTAA
jgi:hypothetical protein